MTIDIDTVLRHYVIAALWSSTGEDEEPLDRDHGPEDVSPEALAEAREIVADFVAGNAADLTDMDSEQIGHDFWLTRNGHGTGFWDRGLGERGDRLTATCKPYGEAYPYVGDDGLIYGLA